MKLLIITQNLDKDNSVLGFFEEWVRQLSLRCVATNVICLEKGNTSLPENVGIFSLGKEYKPSRFRYCYLLLKYVWKLRHEYDVVFVHMNQEYILIVGWLWRLMGKRVVFWRNHRYGGILTRLAVVFAHAVCYTSPDSFTARLKKSYQMPAGIDIEKYVAKSYAPSPFSLLYIGRLSPIKHVEDIIQSVNILNQQSSKGSLSIVGNATDPNYYQELRRQVSALQTQQVVEFLPAVPPQATVEYYTSHGIVINATIDGSLDKTVLEAMACESLVLVANRYYEQFLPDKLRSLFLFPHGQPAILAQRIKKLWELPKEERERLGKILRSLVVEHHSLSLLINSLLKLLSEGIN